MRALARRPRIHNRRAGNSGPERATGGYGFRARAEEARPGMTVYGWGRGSSPRIASAARAAAPDHPGKRHVDMRVERLQHGVPPEFSLQADQLQRGHDLLDLAVLAERQQQALAVDVAALLVAGTEDGVDGVAGQHAGLSGMQREGQREGRHHLVHGAAGPALPERLGDMGAVMQRAVAALPALVLDLPDHQLLRIMDAPGRTEFADMRERPAVRLPAPVQQQCALAR
jgi:hypothetical protein